MLKTPKQIIKKSLNKQKQNIAEGTGFPVCEHGSKSSAEPKSWQMIATFGHSFNIPYMFK